MRKKTKAFILAGSCAAFLPVAAMAQDSEELLRQLEDQNKILEMQVKIAENKRALALASFPETKSKGREGKISIHDDFGALAALVAHRALAKAADKVVERVSSEIASRSGSGNNCQAVGGQGEVGHEGGGNAVVVATEPMDYAALGVFRRMFKEQADFLDRKFNEKLGKASSGSGTSGFVKSVGTSISVVEALLGGAADVASFFKRDVEAFGRTVDVGDEVVIRSVVAALRKSGVKVFEERPRLVGLHEEGASSILKRLAGLRGEIVALSMKTEGLKRKLKELRARKKPSLDEKKEMARLMREIGENTALTDAAARFWREWVVPEDGSSSRLLRLLHMELLERKGVRCVLEVDVESAGADIVASSRVFQSARLALVGGVVLSYVLRDIGGGVILDAGTVSVAEEYDYELGKYGKGGRGRFVSLSMD